MRVKLRIKGQLMGIGETLKNKKKYLKLYDGNNIINVFSTRANDYESMVGNEVEVVCEMITDNFYIRELEV